MGLFWGLSGIFLTLVFISIVAVIAYKYDVLLLQGAYVALVVIGSILASKIVSFGIFFVPAAVIVASASFFVTDIISELWSKEQAQKTVLVGFLGLVIFAISQLIAVNWSAAPFALDVGKKYDELMMLTPQIAIASIIAFLISQFLDITIFHYLKNKTQEKFLWLRNNGSTLSSQMIDTILFITLAFGGIRTIREVIQLIIGMASVKFLIALMDTPFIYLVIWIIKKQENSDVVLGELNESEDFNVS